MTKKFKFIFNKIILWIFLILWAGACQPIHERGQTFGSSGGSDSGDASPGGNGDIVALEKTRTATVVRGHRYLDALNSCFGINNNSNRTRQTWSENQGTLSESGAANSITSPMLTAMTKISAEVCNDLIVKERAVAPVQRQIFNSINFTAGPDSLSPTQLGSVVRRIARSCWGRNETAEESNLLINTTLESFAGGANGAQETIDHMIFLCSAMSSSFSAFEM